MKRPNPSLGTATACIAVLALALGVRWIRAEASEAAPPRPAETFLGLRPPLDDADHYLASPNHNPTGVVLSPEDEARLQSLIDAANARLDLLQSKIGEVARAWARLRIANGNFELARPGEDKRHHRGTLLLRVADRYGVKRDVVIQPGECAELDVLTADIDAGIEAAHREVADFLRLRTERSLPDSQ